MVVDPIALIFIGIAIGVLLSWFIKLCRPPIVGELTIDTHEWDVDRYDILVKVPFVDLENYKYVTLEIKQYDYRAANNGFNDTD